MLKFMKHQQKLTPERIQRQKELFAFTKGCHHGFPAKPSALAWDPKLRLLALATKNAEIRVYGDPGIELYGNHENAEVAVTHLTFLPGTCNLVSLCEDNSLHLWKMCAAKGETMQLVQEKTTSLEGKLKKISIIVPDAACENLMVGTEGGNIYLLNLSTFQMSDNIIYQDVVMQNVPEDYKVNPGPVEAIAEHPIEADKILIGYQRGLIVLWDKKNLQADQTYVCSQQLESMCWMSDGSEFTTSHNDGSYMTWSTTDSATPKDGPHTVYGPFPCKPINKILRPTSKEGDLIVFGGGMPRASFGDRNTVTAIQDEEHVTFNLTSKVIDFLVVEEEETGGASCLVILAEEEIVFLDLATEGWPAFSAPYLASLHTSAITCSTLVSAVSQDVFEKLKNADNKQQSEISSRSWPINGGTPQINLTESKGNSQRDLLLTGHEDGTVRFWDASGISLKLIYKMSTAPLFVSEDLGGDEAAAEDDDWPPFRKAGLFDPYSDDPRLGIKKMEMCAFTGIMVVAGTAGQIIVLNLVMEEKEMKTQLVDVNLVAENDNFVWKSHSKLDMITEAVKFDAGMHPSVVIQFYPPASCTSLTLNSEWGVVALGTAHGFALFDFIQKKNLLAKSTLSALDLANAADEGPMSRRKSLKKSLRESFRRLRRGRSQRKTGKPLATSPAVKREEDENDEWSDGEEIVIDINKEQVIAINEEEEGTKGEMREEEAGTDGNDQDMTGLKENVKKLGSKDSLAKTEQDVTGLNENVKKFGSKNSVAKDKVLCDSKNITDIQSPFKLSSEKVITPVPYFYIGQPKEEEIEERKDKTLLDKESANKECFEDFSKDNEELPESVPFLFYITPKYIEPTFIKSLKRSISLNESNKEKECEVNKKNSFKNLMRKVKSEDAEEEENKLIREKMRFKIITSKFNKKDKSIDVTENEVLKNKKRKDLESNFMKLLKKQWIIKKESITKDTSLDKNGEKKLDKNEKNLLENTKQKMEVLKKFSEDTLLEESLIKEKSDFVKNEEVVEDCDPKILNKPVCDIEVVSKDTNTNVSQTTEEKSLIANPILSRPKKFWMMTRSQSVKEVSCNVTDDNEALENINSQPSELQKNKQMFLSLLRISSNQEDSSKDTKKEDSDTDKKVIFTDNESKFRKLVRQKSEIIMRTFSRDHQPEEASQNQELQMEKNTAVPIIDIESKNSNEHNVTSITPTDLSTRHPSIETSIDQTPLGAAPCSESQTDTSNQEDSSKDTKKEDSDTDKKVIFTDNESKFRKLIRQKSEIIMRTFSRDHQPEEASQNQELQMEKNTAVPIIDIESKNSNEHNVTTVTPTDLSTRHPSIETYIDQTPLGAAPCSESQTDTLSPLAIRQNLSNACSQETLNSHHSNTSFALDIQSLYSSPDNPDTMTSKFNAAKVGRIINSTLDSSRLTFNSLAPFNSSGVGAAAVGSGDDEVVRPVERAIESRSHASDYIGSMVRCLHLTKCFIATNQVMSATLWAGTNSGTIYVFTIAIPPHEKRSDTPLAVQLGKEIHLKHGAPVVSINVLDGLSRPFPAPMAVKKEASAPPDTSSPHRVLICSEEQFKVFTLPQLKPFCKFKLTAHEGSRVRKIGLSTFNSTADKSSEPAFLVVTNLGDFSAYSLPDCRRQLHTILIKKEDINGINSCVFSARGEALYSVSPCELARVSFSAQHITQAYGALPAPNPPKPSATTAAAAEAAAAAALASASNAEADDSQDQNKSNAETLSEDSGATAKEVSEESGEKAISPSLKTGNTEKESKVSNETNCTKKEEIRENGDNSVLSGDITIDSIRDHMDELKISEKVVESVSSSDSTVGTNSISGTMVATNDSCTTVADISAGSETATSATESNSGSSKQESSSSVTVVKSTTITSVSSQVSTN